MVGGGAGGHRERASRQAHLVRRIFPQLGAPLGFIIANGLFLTVDAAMPHPRQSAPEVRAFLSWGWQLSFLFSAVMVVVHGPVGAAELVESAAFVIAEKRPCDSQLPAGETLQHHWREVVLGTLIMLAAFTCCST